MFLLDTNVISELMKVEPDDRVLAWVDEQQISSLYISSVTRAEIELGIALLPQGRRKEKFTAAAKYIFEVSSTRLLVFEELAAIEYGQLVAHRTRIGRPITVEDAQIASIALVHGLRVVTRNVRDFENITELTVINPWEIE